MNIQSVLFDMDGLMFDSERIYLKALEESAVIFGHDADSNFFHRCIGKNSADTIEMIKVEYGNDFPAEEMCTKTRDIFKNMKMEGDMQLKKGLMEFISLLEKHNIPRCIVSSSSRNAIEDNLKMYDLTQYFPNYVGGDEVANGKPNPEGYLKAAKLVGCKPSYCIALEDSEPGIRAAYAAGTIPIMIPDIVEPSDSIKDLAHKIFPSLIEARDYLADCVLKSE